MPTPSFQSISSPPPPPPSSPPRLRNIFDPLPLHGQDIAAARMESVAASHEARRLWVGTSDGFLQAFTLDPATGSTTLTSSSPASSPTRANAKASPLSHLTPVSAWGLLLGLWEGNLTGFDLDSGTWSFSVEECLRQGVGLAVVEHAGRVCVWLASGSRGVAAKGEGRGSRLLLLAWEGGDAGRGRLQRHWEVDLGAWEEVPRFLRVCPGGG
ncbi:hypothetical protein Naga_100923g1, partial [Nannochloropsis gaditana]